VRARWSAIAAITLIPALAEAHHAVSDFGVAWIEPVRVLELELEWTAFEYGEVRGDAQQLSLLAEIPLGDLLSISARLPFASVAFAGRERGAGLGDPEVGVKVAVLSDDALVVSLGAGLELPIGDEDRGLGGGHFELTPFVIGSWAPIERAVILASLQYHVALGEEDHHHLAALAPHEAHEIGGRLSVAWLEPPGYLLAGVKLSAPLVESELGTAFDGRVEIGAMIFDELRAAIRLDVPISGERAPNRASIGVAWLF
jgi:hypothetical protein